MKKTLALLVLISLAVIIYSFFLPYYEGPRSENHNESASFVVIGFYETAFAKLFIFNGFGSLFALFNFAQVVVLLCGFFWFPRALATPIVVTILFIISLLVVNMGITASWGRPFKDTMLEGFYVTILAMIVLIACSFIKYIYLLKHNSTLLE